MMPIGTSLLLCSPGPASPAPSFAADSCQSHLLPNDWGGQVRAQPAPWLSSLPRSSRWASCGGTGGTHPLPKESPPGNTAKPPRWPQHLTSPLGVCLPESPCLLPGRSQAGTAGCGITHRARRLWSTYNHHLPTQGAAGWGGRAASSGISQQDPYPSSSCIPHQRWEPRSPWHATASPLPARSLGQVLAPGKPAGAEGMPEEGRLCMQERACAHVKEKEAGL